MVNLHVMWRPHSAICTVGWVYCNCSTTEVGTAQPYFRSAFLGEVIAFLLTQLGKSRKQGRRPKCHATIVDRSLQPSEVPCEALRSFLAL